MGNHDLLRWHTLREVLTGQLNQTRFDLKGEMLSSKAFNIYKAKAQLKKTLKVEHRGDYFDVFKQKGFFARCNHTCVASASTNTL